MSRVLLSPENQKALCLAAKQRLNCSWRSLGRFLNISSSTFDNWYRCERLLPEEIFIKLISISGLSISGYKLLSDNWGRIKGGNNNVELHGKFFGTLEGRREGARRGRIKRTREFSIPDYSKNLAEFIGIMLGDGGMDKSQISVTLGYSTDYGYIPYITSLIKKLFNVRASLYRSSNRDFIRIRVSGINLVRNLLVLGLVSGNKVEQQFDIPGWISSDVSYIKACIRGMIDTDGCVHRKVKREKDGIEYRSIGITFSSSSKHLQGSFIKLMARLGFKAAVSGTTIYLCGKEQIEKYVREIGFSNPKHLNRYKSFLKDYGWVKIPPKIVSTPNLQYNSPVSVSVA